MRTILVTNDDGVRSDGIHALAAGLASLGEVTIVAPMAEASAIGHALTLRRPLRIEEVSPRVYSVDGTPTDCVNLAITTVLKSLPEKPTKDQVAKAEEKGNQILPSDQGDWLEVAPAVLAGSDITGADAVQPQNSVSYSVSLDFSGKGGDAWADVTGKAGSMARIRARTVGARAAGSTSPRIAIRSDRIMATMLSAIIASDTCSHGV